MILTNNEIIDLYHESNFDAIITDLKLDPQWNTINKYDMTSISNNMEYSHFISQRQYNTIGCKLVTYPNCQIEYESDVEYILAYAISTSNIVLIEHLFTVKNINSYSVVNMMRNPLLYPTLELLLERDANLCNRIADIINLTCSGIISHDIVTTNNIPLLKIILKYIPLGPTLRSIIRSAICLNNLEILDILLENNYDIQSTFNELMDILEEQVQSTVNEQMVISSPVNGNIQISSNTIIYLETHYIDISKHINQISKMYVKLNDLNGIKYCLVNGIDINYLLKSISCYTNISTIKYLMENRADINCINGADIIHLIKCEIYNGKIISIFMDIIIYLIDLHIDISDCKFELLLYAGIFNHLGLLLHIIELDPDIIHIEDNLLLSFMAYVDGTDASMVKLLVDLGANVINDQILLFSEGIFLDKLQLLYSSGARTHFHGSGLYPTFPKIKKRSHPNWHQTIKFLIKSGAIINDVQYIFSICVDRTYFDVELFNIFLDMNVDLNSKIDKKCGYDNYARDGIEYLLEVAILWQSVDIIKLFLKHGADPSINLNGPLRTAIRAGKKDIILLLLEVGCELDPEFECAVNPDVITILEKFEITNHKLYLKKIEK